MVRASLEATSTDEHRSPTTRFNQRSCLLRALRKMFIDWVGPLTTPDPDPKPRAVARSDSYGWLSAERNLTAISPAPNPRDPFSVLRPAWLCTVKVDVDSTSRPEPVSHHRLFVSDVVVRVSEDDQAAVFHDRIEIHHPRGWMGIAARFLYELDSRTYLSFGARAEWAHELALTRFPADKIISVALLGTGEARYP